MIILGTILLSVITAYKSLSIVADTVTNFNVDLAEKGYKYKNGVLNQKNVQSGNSFNIVLLIIPGVNLLTALVMKKKIKNEILNNPEIKENIIPMTDEEKNVYSYLDNKKEKNLFIILARQNPESIKQINDELDGVNSKNYCSVSLQENQLLALSYTIDEVKELNSATEGVSKIGKIDGINVAIIGIPSGKEGFNSIKFLRENYRKIHAIEDIEDINNKRFIVYPYNGDFNEQIGKTIDRIKQQREKNSINNSVNIDQLKLMKANLIMDSYDYHEEQQRHVYQKK